MSSVLDDHPRGDIYLSARLAFDRLHPAHINKDVGAPGVRDPRGSEDD